jgi:hypothetical protein
VQIFQYPFTTQNGSVTDPTSLQTGPLDSANQGSPYNLGWAHVVVNLTTNGLLNVFYKNTPILTNFVTGFVPGPGQLVMAGRTGGLNENQDVDDVTITTTVTGRGIQGLPVRAESRHGNPGFAPTPRPTIGGGSPHGVTPHEPGRRAGACHPRCHSSCHKFSKRTSATWPS